MILMLDNNIRFVQLPRQWFM